MQKVFIIIKNYLLNFILSQLIISLISIPILIYWGIPISKMSFLGNFIFLPILIIFLILSSIIFFSEMFHLPNNIFIYLLEKTTNLWEFLLNTGKKSWLIGFKKTNLILIIIPILTFLILNNKKINTKNKKILFLVLLLIISMGTLKIINNIFSINKIFINNKISITRAKNNSVKIKDYKMFTSKQSPEKFVEFELKTKIIKNFGTIKVEKITTKKASTRVFQGIIACNKFLEIKEVKLPYFNTKLNKYGWKMFFKMKKILEKNNITLTRF